MKALHSVRLFVVGGGKFHHVIALIPPHPSPPGLDGAIHTLYRHHPPPPPPCLPPCLPPSYPPPTVLPELSLLARTRRTLWATPWTRTYRGERPLGSWVWITCPRWRCRDFFPLDDVCCVVRVFVRKAWHGSSQNTMFLWDCFGDVTVRHV